MTNESKFGIPEEPKNTCPLIDKFQANLDNFSDELEELRKANETIRSWGDAWQLKCIEVSGDLEEAQDQIYDLESEKESLEELLEEAHRNYTSLDEENDRLRARLQELE